MILNFLHWCDYSNILHFLIPKVFTVSYLVNPACLVARPFTSWIRPCFREHIASSLWRICQHFCTVAVKSRLTIFFGRFSALPTRPFDRPTYLHAFHASRCLWSDAFCFQLSVPYHCLYSRFCFGFFYLSSWDVFALWLDVFFALLTFVLWLSIIIILPIYRAEIIHQSPDSINRLIAVVSLQKLIQYYQKLSHNCWLCCFSIYFLFLYIFPLCDILHRV